MFEHLFDRYLKQSGRYKHMKRRMNHLEKELERLHHLQKPVPSKGLSGSVNPSMFSFPSTLTINLNKREEHPPINQFQNHESKKTVKRPTFKKTNAEANSTSPPSQASDTKPVEGPTQTTYIEFLNVEKLVIDRYEQSNNFGALGIKSLEGRLNIGANYADPSQLPEEAQEKLKEKMKAAEELKAYKKSKMGSETPKKPPVSQYPFDQFKQIETMETFFDWDDFFSNQPKDADNNQ